MAGTRSRTTKSQSSAKNRTARTPASKRKPAAGNQQPKRGRPPKTSPGTKRAKTLEEKKSRNQTFAIVLFAVSIFLFCLVLVPGDSVWNWLHTMIQGLFGSCAIGWPILLTYVSVATALEKPVQKLSTKIWLSITMIILFCACIFIFNPGAVSPEKNYFQKLSELYGLGAQMKGAGLFSGILGIPFVSVLGGTGSKIVIILLLFVNLMILTGTSLIQLFRAVTKPVDMAGEYIGNTREERRMKKEALELQERKRTDAADIDISLDDMPAHPVISPDAAMKERILERNDKLEQLKRAVSAPMPTIDTDLKKEKKARRQKESGIPAAGLDMAGAMPPRKKLEERPMDDNGAAAAAAAFAAKKRNLAETKSDPAQKQPDPQSISIKVEPYPEGDNGEPSYRFPPVSLLDPSPETDEGDVTHELQTYGQMLVDTLKSFGVQTKIVDISRGPAVTRYELQPAAGVKISKITNLADDIALNLAASGVRIEAPIPGKAAVGIEVPNKVVNVVKMRELVESNSFRLAKSKLTVTLGRDIAGQVTLTDLAKMPHLLIAGSTGSGKSVCINSLIISLLYKSTPSEVRFLMVDPKVVELGIYNGIPHLLVPVVTDPRKAAGALNWAVNEMLNRYKIFAQYNVRDLHAYNRMVAANGGKPPVAEGEELPKDEKGQEIRLEKMPQIVIIIDELADLMMAAPNEVEDSICRLAQMARAAGMHLVIATQRPSVDVITGIIKANIPSRIAFAVSSAVDSRTILDSGGAEKLLGRGDMLFAPVGSPKPVRIQGCFVTDAEIEKVVDFVKKSQQESAYDQNIIEEIEKNAAAESGKDSGGDSGKDEDPVLKEAVKCVVEAGQASTSLLQRRLSVGYARAGRLIDEMEQMGIIGPYAGSKPRQVLITYQQWLEMSMRQADESEE